MTTQHRNTPAMTPAHSRSAPAAPARQATRPCSTRSAARALALVLALVVLGLSGPAAAGVEGVLTFDGAFVATPDAERFTDARGAGMTMRVFGKREPFNLQVGAFAALGRPASDRLMRDIYDVHLSMGLNPPTKKSRLLVPFASLGVDFLYVSTRAPDGNRAAGMTMGLDLRGGVFGHITEDWMYTATAAYIGAVVPGTGEGLDGLVFQVGIGKRLFD